MTDASSQMSHEALKAIIEEICIAFADVKRDGGISWSETEVIDGYGSEEERQQARGSDKDTHWNQLIDDPKWQPFGFGGFNFIDEIGFRYYLPPTMIRFLRGDITEYFGGHLLSKIDGFVREGDPMWTTEQLESIARFILFMAASDPDAEGRRAWESGLKTRWIAKLPVFHSPYK